MIKHMQMQYGSNVYADEVYAPYQPANAMASYPDPNAMLLRQVLAKHNDVPIDMIICGNGSDELIDMYIRTYSRTSRLVVAFAPPMYYQYPVYAERAGAQTLALPHDRRMLTPRLLADLGCQPSNTAIMIDNPSNPAGDVISRHQFLQLLDIGYKVFADEAYYEYYGETVADLVPHYPQQLVISRTFSKFYAMAGSRLGYAIASPDIIAQLNAHRMLFNVNVEAQRRGQFALTRIPDFTRASHSLRQTKEWFDNKVKAIGGYTLFSSLDLYVLFAHVHIPAKNVHAQLIQNHGIETYLYENFKDQSAIRATVLHQQNMQRLIDALEAIHLSQ